MKSMIDCGCLERHFGPDRQSPRGLAPHLVDSMVEVLHEVKEVGHDLGIGKVKPDDIK